MSKYIKSPLNYTGGKYKLLPQILPLFPNNIETFVDLFAGGCNVSINVDAKRIIANDINRPLMEIYNFFQTRNAEELIKEIAIEIDESGTSIDKQLSYLKTTEYEKECCS